MTAVRDENVDAADPSKRSELEVESVENVKLAT